MKSTQKRFLIKVKERTIKVYLIPSEYIGSCKCCGVFNLETAVRYFPADDCLRVLAILDDFTNFEGFTVCRTCLANGKVHQHIVNTVMENTNGPRQGNQREGSSDNAGSHQ